MAAFDPHRTYVRMGECRRCGRCCDLHCPHFSWVANRQLNPGETFAATGKAQPIMAVCNASPKPETCARFPADPSQTPPKCGYFWVEVRE